MDSEASSPHTSETEEMAVATRNYAVSGVKFDFYCTSSGNSHLTVTMDSGNARKREMKSSNDHRETYDFMKEKLRAKEVETFDLIANVKKAKSMDDALKALGRMKPFKVKTLNICYSFPTTVREVFKLFEEVQRVSLTCIRPPKGKEGVPMDTFNKIPLIAEANHLCILSHSKYTVVLDLVKDWLKTDVKLGKLFHFLKIGAILRFVSTVFAEQFEDRLVSHNDTRVRIRTSNPSRHILATFDEYQHGRLVEVRGGVIPADFPEAEEQKWLERIEVF